MSAAKETSQVIEFNIKCPLPDGRVLVQGPLTYNADGLATRHNADFLKDPKFRESYRLNVETSRIHGHDPSTIHVEWRVYVCCWAAAHAMNLPGDFVECGVLCGGTSIAVANYVDFHRSDKTFYLADTFKGIPIEQLSDNERRLGMGNKNQTYSIDTYEYVKNLFEGYNAKLIKGKIPDTLPQIDTDQVCYLSIDMNITKPEIEAAEYFWDKLVPGAVVILDDYGFNIHYEQKQAFDQFAQRKGVPLLTLPSGQGLIIKP